MCQPASPGSSGVGEPHRDRAADAGVADPAARAQQLVARLADQPGGARGGERRAARGDDPDHRLDPGGGVVAAHTVRGQFGPDDVLAGADDVRRDRAADGDEAVGDEPVDLVRAEHRARMTAGRFGPPANFGSVVTMGKRRILR
jgi:hypothetical protein